MGIIAKSRVDVTAPRQQDMPLDGFYHVEADGVEVTSRRTPAWEAGGAGKIGFGLGRFGYGAFGFGDGGAGFGGGLFGYGPFGFGTPAMTIRTDLIDDGTYDMEIVGYDAAENPSTSNPTDEVILAGVPADPGFPSATSYDDGTDVLVLTLDALSEDDEG